MYREKKFYICKRLRMLEHLKKNGFLPIRSEPDIHNPRYTVWIFENSPELLDTIDEFIEIQARRLK